MPESKTDNIANYKTIMGRIDGFRETMESTYKSGGSIAIDSAIWNLEALITFDEAYPDSSSQDFTIKSSVFTLSVDQNHEVLETDVQDLYDDMLDTIAYQLDQFTEEVKFLAFSDVELIEINGEIAYLRVTNGYGFKFLLGIYEPFDEDDDWYWGTVDEEYGGELLGKCDGTEVGISDGSNEIQYRLNNPVVSTEARGYTDLETFYVSGEDFVDDDDDPRLFWGWSYPIDECLDNDTLTYYLIQSHDIIQTYVLQGGLRPEGKYFMSVHIIDDIANYSGNIWHYHWYQVTYGKPYTITD